MLLIAGIIITLLALELRRRVIWFHTDDFVSYFDQHENCIQTPFYYSIVKFLGYITEIPYHGMKWLSVVADIAVAACSIFILGKSGEEMQKFILYTACLLGPVFFIRGSVWAREDAIATAFILIAYWMMKSYGNKKNKKRYIWMAVSVLLTGLGIAFYPFSTLLVILLNIYGEGEKSRVRTYVCIISVAIAICVNIITGQQQGLVCGQSIYAMFRFLSYDPVSGQKYASAVVWLYHLFLLSGYSISLVTVWGAYRKKISVYVPIIIQFAVMICYGTALGWC